MAAIQILVVEDDPDISELVACLLRDVGYTVETARDGRHALALIESYAPAVILVDQKMPGMNGIEFMRAARDRGTTAAFIGMSASDTNGCTTTGSGFDAFLTKPFEIDDVLNLVRSFITSTTVVSRVRSARRSGDRNGGATVPARLIPPALEQVSQTGRASGGAIRIA